MSRINFSLVMAVFLLSGCATFSRHNSDYAWMDRKAVGKGFKKIYLSAPPFILTAYQKLNAPSDVMVVYIEGDGYAWVSRAEPSDDPTPKHPLALDLAGEDPSPNVLYVARPGQFLEKGAPAVNQDYWTSKIYSREVIDSINGAIDQVKHACGADKISLVGFSGGGAVAVLAAAGRMDVIALRTVAGNLATDVFARVHHVSPLTGSIDPVSVAQEVKAVPQRHFIGRHDTVVTKAITEAFLDAEGDMSDQSLTEVKSADHLNGWVERWRELLSIPLSSHPVQ